MFELKVLEHDFTDRLLTMVAEQEYETFLNGHETERMGLPLLVNNYNERHEDSYHGFYPHSEDATYEMQLLFLHEYLEPYPQAQATLGQFYDVTNRLNEETYARMDSWERAKYFSIPSVREIGTLMSITPLIISMKDALLSQDIPPDAERFAAWDEERDGLYGEKIVNWWLNEYFSLIEPVVAFETAQSVASMIQERIEKLQYTVLFTHCYEEDMIDVMGLPSPEGFTAYDRLSAVMYAQYLDYVNPIRGGGFSCTN